MRNLYLEFFKAQKEQLFELEMISSLNFYFLKKKEKQFEDSYTIYYFNLMILMKIDQLNFRI
ncbi:unnamed protein product [Paramecium sonneborni]|uniref:Uncharacterized protein n=1 Tax=Paramecium sonneborni TaxID=65129 RepID=A0A8S1Q3Z6_9CILI|nr:unnamed protein product [Paramecium sonneborni]